jgi:hypothetical protein
MITALECKRQSVLYIDEARAEDGVPFRTGLLALSRSWSTIAIQVERMAALRAAKPKAASD